MLCVMFGTDGVVVRGTRVLVERARMKHCLALGCWGMTEGQLRSAFW